MFISCTAIFVILMTFTSLRETSAQLPNYFQGGNPPNVPGSNSWQNFNPRSSGFSQYQPYSAPTLQSPTPSTSTAGQYPTSSQLSTISQLSGYNRLSSAAVQTDPWRQYQTNSPRAWSIPSSIGSASPLSQFQNSGPSGYARPTTMSSPVSPNQIQGTPFQTSWSINHQAASPAVQSASPVSPQSYNIPTTVAAPQVWSPPTAPVARWNTPTTQAIRSPQTAPVNQWTPPSTQTYSAPQQSSFVRPPQAETPTATTYQSPQNAQNNRPAPVHYANIGPQLQGDYKFGYHTGDGGSFREETRLPDGTVQGAYGFIDADGKQRIVRYRAGKDGFQAEGDDVPKGSPVTSEPSSAQPSQPTSGPINIDEGAAFRSFSQG